MTASLSGSYMGIKFLDEQIPAATTLLHFRRMKEKSKTGERRVRASTMSLSRAAICAERER